MVFVDGTNLFYRLRGASLQVPELKKLFAPHSSGELVRTYLYTSAPHFEAAVKIHGQKCFDGIRVVFGTAVALGDGNYKEKGVDALLVADLVYHAASKNCQSVLLVSTDVDFAHALQRVEDFGCRTSVLAICSEAPPALRDKCDRYFALPRERIIANGIGLEMQQVPESSR